MKQKKNIKRNPKGNTRACVVSFILIFGFLSTPNPIEFFIWLGKKKTVPHTKIVYIYIIVLPPLFTLYSINVLFN